MQRQNYIGKRSTKNAPTLMLTAIILVFMALLIVGIWKGREAFFKNHYVKNTIIEGVDCSYLSVEKATSKISETLDQQTITIIFKDTQYNLQGKDLGITMSDNKELFTILQSQQQQQNDDYTYILEESITVSEDVTRKYLSSIRELKEENMIEPVDAHIKVCEDGTLAIESEILGSKIDFNEALDFCINCIKNGDTTIDFTPLVAMPNVLSTDSRLNQNVNEVNNILTTVINFQLADGSLYTLDKETTKTWVATDENGSYYVDFENVHSFVKELSNQAKQSSEIRFFTPTGMSAPIELSGILNAVVDSKKEAEKIITELLEGGEHTRKPIYKEGYSPEELLSYIEVDITRQIVWVYVNGECVLTTPCVTGVPPKHSTPTGVYHLSYKKRNATLTGYNDDGSRYESKVSYWMPFNGGVGFHDAKWQPTFGGDWYLTHGSHGCVNLPTWAAPILYSYINTNMPIIVYCS